MDEQDEEVVAARPRSKRRRLFAVAGLGVLLLFGGVGVLRFGPFAHEGTASAKSTASTVKPVLVDVPDIISNLDTGGHRATFVKMHAKIPGGDAATARAVEADMPRVLDLFQTYLRSMRPDELKGGEGVYRLREALIYRLDGVLAPATVDDVLFTELLVQ